MKNRLTIACLTLLVVIAASLVSAQTPAYHANVLGISDGRTNIQVEVPKGMNRWGQVIGTYGGGTSGGTHAVLWTPASANDGTGQGISGAGTLFSIESSAGLPPGTANSTPYGLNDRGQVAGMAYTPGQGDGNQNQSWLWNPTTLNSTKGVLHGSSGSAVTFPLIYIAEKFDSQAEYSPSISNHGTIAATAFGLPLLWTPTTANGMTGTWTYDATHNAQPSAINDAGQTAGMSCNSYTFVGPYLHTGALPLLSGDYITSSLWISPSTVCNTGGIGLNAAGHVAISAVDTANVQHAYFYKSGAVRDISTGLYSVVEALNSYDQVVGYAITDTTRAYLFHGGTAVDLNTLSDATGGLQLQKAIAINSAGQMLVVGSYPGGTGATVLLQPNALVFSPVVVTKGTMQISGTTYSQTVTVMNSSTAAITGPISVAVDRLTSGVTLTNKTGTTVYTGPGSVYVNVSTSDLQPGATTAAFTLVFSNPSLKTINYSPRVLGSSAPR